MKNLLYVISFAGAITIAQSCKKQMDRPNGLSKQIVIDTALASDVVFHLSLAPYGDADDIATITKQATNYTTSEIINTAGIFSPVYNYSASAKTGISDQVVLSINEGDHNGNHSSRHCDSTTITINFVIK